MSNEATEDFKEYVVNLDVIVTSTSEEEAEKALERSGITQGSLIGEAMIGNVERPEEL